MEKHVQAKDLCFGQIVLLDNGKTYHVISSQTYPPFAEQGKYVVWLSPTEGIETDIVVAVPPEFSYLVVDSF